MYNVEAKRNYCEIMLRHFTFKFIHDMYSKSIGFQFLVSIRTTGYHHNIFVSHHNLFLSRSWAVNEQACICIERLQYCSSKRLVSHFSNEQMMKDGLAASHFQLLEAKLAHSINKL